MKGMAKMLGPDESQWPTELLVAGVWTIFLTCLLPVLMEEEGRNDIQLFPGETPGTSYTIQNYLMEKEPSSEKLIRDAQNQFEFLRYVVQEEDYATGLKQQKALESGAKEYVMFGKNEEGGHNFHRWVDQIIDTKDEDLSELFMTG